MRSASRFAPETQPAMPGPSHAAPSTVMPPNAVAFARASATRAV